MKLKNHLEKARKEEYALGQFNFSTLQQLRGIVEAAKRKQVPVILGTSRGESEFIGLKQAVKLVEALRETYSEIYLNLDHGKDLEWIEKAIEAGYDMIHFDGSDLSLEENIRKTQKVEEMLKEDMILEGEVGKVGGSSELHNSSQTEKNLTSTENLVKFIKQTQVDLCALAIGNVHGIYEEMPELDFDLLEEIKGTSDIGLVLHGGSGIDSESVRKTIRSGVVKVNVNTELRKVWRNQTEKGLTQNKKEVTPYKLLSKVKGEIRKKVEEKINTFYNL